ncbi:SDR family oxidoreductase [Robiginitalea sp. SC105]|uniref:SDR family oxidoreductase n=1 Tax=Robiginitalea sp. SC105 TaxID=2762332 RepID=UPI001639BFC2|nr:SDR family oxidoreductase [Robiginitalea sp. SC105]MBC2840732.1 SDR family oxidoreductase [Robiginitalea sp. SC105]
MKNKGVVLITGASSGLGEATANFLAGKGYRVYGTSRNPSRISGAGAVRFLRMDVREEASVQEAVAELLRQEGRIDILINNAGVGITGPLEETPHEACLDAMETNFHGPLRVIRSVVPAMRKQGEGFIVNITSIAGYMGLPYRGVYSAGKSALGIATEAYRMELRSFGILMCTLAPGDYSTNIAAGRFHSPLRENSPYRETYGNSLDLMNDHVDSGNDPMEVARKIHGILQKKNPKVHYAVGSPMQRFSLSLKRLLPDKIFERLLLKHYKL